jgi:hypothetical protein
MFPKNFVLRVARDFNHYTSAAIVCCMSRWAQTFVRRLLLRGDLFFGELLQSFDKLLFVLV